MKDMFVRQNGMSRNAVQEGLQEPFPAGDKSGILLGLRLLDSVIADRLL